jgi:hypothetical protein
MPQQADHKIIVICVTNTHDLSEHHITDARKVCEERNIHFRHRMYDAVLFRHDKKYIKCLPAYHIVQNNNHLATIYPSDNIKDILDDYILKTANTQSLIEQIMDKFRRKNPLSSKRY